MSATILVVEDDPSIRSGLVTHLELAGHTVREAEDGITAQQIIESGPPDLLLLDLMIPELDGISLLKWLRRRDRNLPVLILSARGREDQKVAGLRAGADDYLAKPFGLDELSARIDALLRRAFPEDLSQQFGDLVVDLETEHATFAGEELRLSKTEWRILAFFIRRPGACHPRERIHAAVWEDPGASDVRTVDYHVMNLRKKIESDPTQPVYLQTRVGRGYEWVSGGAESTAG